MPLTHAYQTVTQDNGTLRVYSNMHGRDTLSWEDLTDAERKQFDYRDADDGAEFVRYRGWTYDLSDTERACDILAKLGWDGQHGDSYFSGVVFRFEREEWDRNAYTGRVICGTYVC
jgi:hypothetical protein